MAHRFYTITAAGLRAVPQDVDCLTDFAAMVHAKSILASEGSIEIWFGTRLVGEVGQKYSRWAPAALSNLSNQLLLEA